MIVDTEATHKNVGRMYKRGYIAFAIGVIVVLAVLGLRNIDLMRSILGI